MPTPLVGASLGGETMKGGRRGASVKTLKRMLKKAGLKVSGKKATLTRRAKKAHLKMRGGVGVEVEETPEEKAAREEAERAATGGRRRRRGTRNSRRGGNHGVQCDPGYEYVHMKGCVKR